MDRARDEAGSGLMKICNKCKISKPDNQFIKGRRTCKDCISIHYKQWYGQNRDNKNNQSKQWRLDHKGYMKEYHDKNYKRHPKVKIKTLDMVKYKRDYYDEYEHEYRHEYYKNNKDKFIIYKKVFNALSTGKLIRPSNCSCCNKKTKQLHGHHEDYNKPLDVTWLCASCHRKHHSQQKAIKANT